MPAPSPSAKSKDSQAATDGAGEAAERRSAEGRRGVKSLGLSRPSKQKYAGLSSTVSHFSLSLLQSHADFRITSCSQPLLSVLEPFLLHQVLAWKAGDAQMMRLLLCSGRDVAIEMYGPNEAH